MMSTKSELIQYCTELDNKYGKQMGILNLIKFKFFPSEYEQLKKRFLDKMVEYWLEKLSIEYKVSEQEIINIYDNIISKIKQSDNPYLIHDIPKLDINYLSIVRKIQSSHMNLVKNYNSGIQSKLEDYYLHLVSPEEIIDKANRLIIDEISYLYHPLYLLMNILKMISSDLTWFIKNSDLYSEVRQSDLTFRLRERFAIVKKIETSINDYISKIESKPSLTLEKDNQEFIKIKQDIRTQYTGYWPLTTFLSSITDEKYTLPTKVEEDKLIAKIQAYDLIAKNLISNFDQQKYHEFQDAFNKMLINDIPHTFDKYKILANFTHIHHFIYWTNKYLWHYREKSLIDYIDKRYVPRVFGNDLILSLWQNYKKIIFFDVETTGLQLSDDDIIEYSFVSYERKEDQIIKSDVLEILIKYNDQPYLSETIKKLTSITDNDIKEKGVSPEEARELLYQFLLNNKEHLFIAYNTQFDLMFIKKFLSTGLNNVINDLAFIDLLYVVQQLRFYVELKDFKLGTLINYYSLGKHHTKAHRATDDAEVLCYLAKEIEYSENILLSNYINQFGYYSNKEIFGYKLPQINYKEIWKKSVLKKFR